MKNTAKLLGIVVLAMAIGLTMTGCPGPGSTGLGDVDIGSTPSFPDDVNGVANKTDAEAILTAFKNANLYSTMYDDARDLVDDYLAEEEIDLYELYMSADPFSYSTGDLVDADKTMQVSASGSRVITMSSNLQNIYDLMYGVEDPSQIDMAALAGITLSTSDYSSASASSANSAELLKDKTSSGIKLLAGSLYRDGNSQSSHSQITKNATIADIMLNNVEGSVTFVITEYAQAAFTIVNSEDKGIRVVFNYTRTLSESFSGSLSEITGGASSPAGGSGSDPAEPVVDPSVYTGSLLVYGADDEPLIEIPIKDAESLSEARNKLTDWH